MQRQLYVIGWPLDIISTSPTSEFGMRQSICPTNLMMLVVQTLHTSTLISVISTRQRWENWKGTAGFWIISFICFSNEIDPIVISCLLQSFRRDLKNAIKGCRSQMKTFLTEYLDLMIIWTTISTLDWILTNICVFYLSLGILGETSEVDPLLKYNEELHYVLWNIHERATKHYFFFLWVGLKKHLINKRFWLFRFLELLFAF